MRLWALALVLALVPGTALAEEKKSEDGSDRESFFSVVAGAKGGAGGNLWTESKSVPGYLSNFAPFDGYAGGWSGGGGIFGEFRAVWGYVGLEFDLLFERNTMWTEISNKVSGYTWSDAKWLMDWTNVRMPLLLKGYLPLGKARLTLAIGPEFVVGLDPDASVEYTDLDPAVNKTDADNALAAWNGAFDAKKRSYTALTVGIGIAVKVWRLVITFDIRYAYNAGQPEDYLDRVDVKTNGGTFIASNSMDLRLLLGVGYQFEFDL